MRDTMVHRGPDGAGLWISPDGRVGLGAPPPVDHRPVHGGEPADVQRGRHRSRSSSTARSTTTPRSARSSKRIGGHRWKTDHSDTEVILHAFEQWGIDCLQRFRGMFAIALWDGRGRRAVAGPRPHRHQAALLQRPPRPHRRSPPRSRRCSRDPEQHAGGRRGSALPLPVVPDRRRRPRRCSRASASCPAGTWLRIDARTAAVEERRYWDVWDHAHAAGRACREEEIADRVLAELRTAVQLRKVSDVPVGVFLSGGIDSSTNAALFSEGETRPVKTFTIGYEGEYESYQNELHYARRMARAGRRRAPRAPADVRTTSSTSCRGWCSCRTSRSPTRSACRSTTSRSSPATTA